LSCGIAANFTAYTELKRILLAYQDVPELPSYQHLVLGLISGAVGPFTNAPIDTIKTRIQRATKLQGETAWSRIMTVTAAMFKEEGPRAFYKGITPRVARVAPGQAVVFTVYEKACGFFLCPPFTFAILSLFLMAAASTDQAMDREAEVA
jgi:solute carrier family 25 (mitochondrial citrate transporter), member 1